MTKQNLQSRTLFFIIDFIIAVTAFVVYFILQFFNILFNPVAFISVVVMIFGIIIIKRKVFAYLPNFDSRIGGFYGNAPERTGKEAVVIGIFFVIVGLACFILSPMGLMII